MSNKEEKTPMSHEERLALASKLDKELDDFIDNLPRRKQEDIPSFDRWEEEITTHPFFMKESPKPGDKLHPLYEGLAKLKYDPDENEPEDLAKSYKDDGNFNFKYKKYRMAILSYTEGIKARSVNDELNANLYNNRSACHYFLQNYRSSLLDCELALKLKPDYDKSLIRAANCCHHLERYAEGVAYCDRVLDLIGDDKGILDLRQKCVNDSKAKSRDQRKRALASKKLELEEEMIISKIKEKGMTIKGGFGDLTLSRLEPQFPQLFNSRVYVNEEGALVWPVVFFYPQYKIMDYIQHFCEDNTFLDQFSQVFDPPPEWDQDLSYQPHNLNIYYENDKKSIVKINVNMTLLQVLKSDGYTIEHGTPRFIIIVKNSIVEKHFLKCYGID